MNIMELNYYRALGDQFGCPVARRDLYWDTPAVVVCSIRLVVARLENREAEAPVGSPVKASVDHLKFVG